jgi:hypothetical protein
MKSFLIHQVGDWDALKVLVKILGEDNSFQNDHGKKEQIKCFVIISEVFQHQIIEYLPLSLDILLKKIERESRIA